MKDKKNQQDTILSVDNSLDIFLNMIRNERPENWENIPDIDLYMDQVINYMTRQHIGLKLDETITSAMVNNYAKQEIIPRAKGKRYTKEHIAYLTVVCLLKQIIPVSDIKHIFELELKEDNIENLYKKYVSILDYELKKVDNYMENHLKKNNISDVILELAISSYIQKILCQTLINSITEDEEKN